jgi:site-specific recombinase XerD
MSGGIFERPKRSKVFWIDYRSPDGERHREKIGTRDEARKARAARLKEIREGRFIPPRPRRRMTFRELARLALDDKRIRLSPRSHETDGRRLNRILPVLGDLQLEKINRAKLNTFLGDLKNSGLSGPTCNRFHALLGSIFAFGVRQNLIVVNPMRGGGVERFAESPYRDRFLLEADEEKIRQVIRRDCPKREAEFDLALYTGIRRGEQFSLKWSDVHVEAGTIDVEGKTGLRHVRLNATAKAALEELGRRREDGREYVIPEANWSNGRDSRRWFEKAVKASGVPKLEWRTLRHTFASRLAMSGVDIRTIRDLMGHQDIKMTMRYAHLAPDYTRDAAERIARGV